jgi:hypothetical protein
MRRPASIVESSYGTGKYLKHPIRSSKEAANKKEVYFAFVVQAMYSNSKCSSKKAEEFAFVQADSNGFDWL